MQGFLASTSWDFYSRKDGNFASVQKNIGKEFVINKKNCTFVFW